LHRRLGDWWIGAFAGVNAGLFFGDLKLPWTTDIPDSLLRYINMPTGSGIATVFGVYGEWLPENENWGASLKVTLYDNRYGLSETPELDSINMYETRTFDGFFQYISVSPAARFYLTHDDFFASVGFDFDFLVSDKSNYFRTFKNPEMIVTYYKSPATPNKFRVGLNLGLGYDFTITDIYHRFRLMISPFVSAHAGTAVISGNNGNWNNLYLRVGIAFKFGPDKIKTDTLKFDKDYIEPPQILAYVNNAKVKAKGGYEPMRTLPAAELKIVEVSVIHEQITEKPGIALNESLSEKKALAPVVTVREIVPDDTSVFLYNNSQDTRLTPELTEYLDKIAEYYKANPKVTVLVDAHSDDHGTRSQNDQRAKDRFDQVFNYLLNKGIPINRILGSSHGSFIPYIKGSSPAAAAKNRRVEIVVVQ